MSDRTSEFTMTLPGVPTTKLLNRNPEYASFLPAAPSSTSSSPATTSYLTITCSDRNSIGEAHGFYVDKARLQHESVFFNDMAQTCKASSDSVNHRLHVEESSPVVGAVLSALFEPSKDLLSSHASWNDLVKALSLASKWQARSASAPIFHALVSRLDPEQTAPQVFGSTPPGASQDLTALFAEAVRQGEGATRLLDMVVRSYCQKNSVTLGPVSLEGRDLLELGGEGTSRFVNLVVQLVGDGVLVASTRQKGGGGKAGKRKH